MGREVFLVALKFREIVKRVLAGELCRVNEAEEDVSHLRTPLAAKE